MLPKASTDLHAGKGFLAATFDGFTALFPQRDVMTVEQRSHLSGHESTYAMYRGSGISARVFSLSRGLEPVAETGRPYFIVARYRGGFFGLACDELQAINPSQISLKSIPASLKCGNSPIEAFALFGKKIAFQCSLEAIAALLPLEDVKSHAHEQSHPA